MQTDAYSSPQFTSDERLAEVRRQGAAAAAAGEGRWTAYLAHTLERKHWLIGYDSHQVPAKSA